MIHVEMSVDIQAPGKIRRFLERRIEGQLDRTMDRLLEKTEKIQILAYTADDKPAKPPGSNYERTFTLRESSETERTGHTLRNMSGRWYATAPYARYVLGSRAEQANVHRGRWKATETVEEELTDAAPDIIEKELKR